MPVVMGLIRFSMPVVIGLIRFIDANSHWSLYFDASSHWSYGFSMPVVIGLMVFRCQLSLVLYVFSMPVVIGLICFFSMPIVIGLIGQLSTGLPNANSHWSYANSHWSYRFLKAGRKSLPEVALDMYFSSECIGIF
jgi:hypothetical protein